MWDDTASWDTVCDSSACDWKKVYDTGAGHQVTALAVSGNVTYAAYCGPCNPGKNAPFERGLATNVGRPVAHSVSVTGVPDRYITSIAVDPANAAHVYASVGSYSRRWIPDAGVGHVFESTRRRRLLGRHQRQRCPTRRSTRSSSPGQQASGVVDQALVQDVVLPAAGDADVAGRDADLGEPVLRQHPP